MNGVKDLEVEYTAFCGSAVVALSTLNLPPKKLQGYDTIISNWVRYIFREQIIITRLTKNKKLVKGNSNIEISQHNPF